MQTETTGFTPGPWTWHSEDEHPYATLDAPSGVVIDYEDSCPHEADARLIAAAPDLLEALQHLMDRVAFDGVPEDADNQFTEAEAAIAKALGS